MAESAAAESVWQTAKADFAHATGFRLLGVVALLSWLAFQWGWGNDILLPPIVARTFEAVDDGSTWPSALISTTVGTAAGSLFWGLTQTLDGIIVLAGLRLVPGISERIARSVKRQGWVKPFADLSLGAKFLIAYASGASMLCLVDVFATGQPGLAGRRWVLAQSVALSVAGVAVSVAAVLSATAVGLRIPATTAAADTIVHYGANPVTWLVIYSSLFGLSLTGSKVRATLQERLERGKAKRELAE